MRNLVDLKQDILNNKIENLYIFTGEENLIRKIYYEKISILSGQIKFIESVNTLFKELEKKPLFPMRNTYIVYNDMDFLKQKEKVFQRLIKLCKNKTVVLVYDELPEKGPFKEILGDYITIFNKVTDDIALKYIYKEAKGNKISKTLAQKLLINTSNSYNNIVEEVNKYKWLKNNNYSKDDCSNDDLLDALTYACLFYDKKIPPTPKEFANAFIQRSDFLLNAFYDIVTKENILGYIPELYNTIMIALYIKTYGKYDGGTEAYNAGEYWGRIKEIRDLNIPFSKNDLLDIRYLINQLDMDVRSGKMPAQYAWDYMLGVIF